LGLHLRRYRPTSIHDPANHTTDYYYADEYSSACGSPPGTTDAYLTEIRDAKGFTQTFTYRYCDGQLNTATDRNNQTTDYFYGENGEQLDRLTGINYPDCVAQGVCTSSTHSVSYNYGGICPQPSSTNILLQSGSSYTESATLDGVCHVTRNTVTSDPDGTDYTDTVYDGSGRVWKAYNPYRSPSDTSYGFTATTYDALGRPSDEGSTKSIVYPDGGATSTTYSANSSVAIETIIDPAGKKRVLGYDGLGRLTSVTEDPSGLNYSTAYAYDALDDLTTVTQGAQTRAFACDSLSRLTSATNPESGTTTYTYPTPSSICSGDPLSVCTRTDARGITTYYDQYPNGSQCPYDALNRLVCKSYSDGTPAAEFSYDESSVTLGSWTSPALANPNGRLTHTITLNSSGATQTATVQDYDPMGRTQDYWQCTPYSCPLSTLWNVRNNYDLAGDITSWTHPYPFTITNTISTARRITAIQSSWVDSIHPQWIAKSINYTPWGAASRLENGCVGSGCVDGVETYMYNNRLQPVVMEFGNPSNRPSSLVAVGCWAYNYYKDVPMSNLTSCTSPPPQGTQNNGNVTGYFYQDDPYVQPTFNHTAAYTYDGVNRLATAVATPYGTGTVHYNLTFSYTSDGSNGQYGNMSCLFVKNQTVGPCAVPQYAFNSSNNQLSPSQGFAYDAAGNLTTDAATNRSYTWDAEGRITQVVDHSTNNTSTTYIYNAEGQEVELNTAGGQLEQLFDPQGARVGYYSKANSAWLLGYVPWNGRELAKYAWTGELDFHHPNLLGSAWVSTSPAAAVIQDTHFYPWGQPWLYPAPFYDTHFAGIHAGLQGASWIDTTTDEAAHRFYAPSLGRWHSPDPLGGHLEDPQTLNKYAYVRNNPTSLTDPTGLCDVDDEHHNWLWCAAHAVGITTTLQERRDWLAQNIEVSQAGRVIPNYWSTASAAEVNGMYNRAMAYEAIDTTLTILAPIGWPAAKDLVSGGPTSEAVTPFMTTWGWSGSPAYNDALRELEQGGTHEALNGKVPTRDEAIKMIEESGGSVRRIEGAHGFGSESTHDYPHINYTTGRGENATVRIQDRWRPFKRISTS
jgi:RHS repeat-associated protein